MDLPTWIVLGLITGIIATAWQRPLRLSKLILLMLIGAIGSVSGGVMGYLLFGANIGGFDFSIFSPPLLLKYNERKLYKSSGTIHTST